MDAPIITTDRGDWLGWDLARSLSDDVAGIRAELADLQDRFERVMRDARLLPGGEGIWQRVDAYPGTRLDRDMGLGLGPDAWLAEVEDFLAPLTVAKMGEEA